MKKLHKIFVLSLGLTFCGIGVHAAAVVDENEARARNALINNPVKAISLLEVVVKEIGKPMAERLGNYIKHDFSKFYKYVIRAAKSAIAHGDINAVKIIFPDFAKPTGQMIDSREETTDAQGQPCPAYLRPLDALEYAHLVEFARPDKFDRNKQQKIHQVIEYLKESH